MLQHDTYEQFAAVEEAGPRGPALHIFGDVDLSTVGQLNGAIDAATAGGELLLLNLSRCRYFDSSGLAALIRARKRLGPRLTVIARSNTSVYRTLRIVGFDKMFGVVTELETCGEARDGAGA